MITEISDNNEIAPAGWVLYDGECAICIDGAKRFKRTLGRRGFALIPLQEPWVEERLGLVPNALLKEMHLLLPNRQVLVGADAVVHLARTFWWARPLCWVARLPGGKRLFHKIYRWIAAHRYCVAGQCRTTRPKREVQP